MRVLRPLVRGCCVGKHARRLTIFTSRLWCKVWPSLIIYWNFLIRTRKITLFITHDSVSNVSDACVGATGAEVQFVCATAAMAAISSNSSVITSQHFMKAIDALRSRNGDTQDWVHLTGNSADRQICWYLATIAPWKPLDFSEDTNDEQYLGMLHRLLTSLAPIWEATSPSHTASKGPKKSHTAWTRSWASIHYMLWWGMEMLRCCLGFFR